MESGLRPQRPPPTADPTHSNTSKCASRSPSPAAVRLSCLPVLTQFSSSCIRQHLETADMLLDMQTSSQQVISEQVAKFEAKKRKLWSRLYADLNRWAWYVMHITAQLYLRCCIVKQNH